MRQTKILYPLDTDVTISEKKKHEVTGMWKSIKMYLDDIKEGEHIFLMNYCLTLKS